MVNFAKRHLAFQSFGKTKAHFEKNQPLKKPIPPEIAWRNAWSASPGNLRR
jgi:hypothetical protein